MNIAYINENQERLYDNYMLRETLRVSKPKLQRLLGQYKFSPSDYVIHQNKFLYTEDSIVSFIEYIVFRTHLNQQRKINCNTQLVVRERIKKLVRNNELSKDL